MSAGEIRRVPAARAKALVGYYVACPRCSFVTVVIQGDKGCWIFEGQAEESVTFSVPTRCTYCSAVIALTDGELTLTEDDHVRPVRPGRA